MDLTDEQKTTVAGWLAEGMGLAEVQQKLEETFDIKLTFMDVRFLVDDLDLTIQDKPEPEPEASDDKAPEAAEPGEPSLVDEGGAPGSISVEVDKVQRPGAMVSGTATFSDGNSMGWQVDQMGRLGLIPGVDKDYRPSEEDLAEFQMVLQSELQKQGF
ncbi:hypothetical protein [Rubellicoccus peritrichatus]|uniref:Uncharacterized protein n=1 Tax=Rubellicoccus peritrichatus TaxID=3080537 RepID=A0AAQ3QT02_9BACT|nr:hypothetical protein [Puniceicoccus sp. CR14]WOO40771.1 hypothetical protein RZN69_19280 [Puniceicoccus sp. CR14]